MAALARKAECPGRHSAYCWVCEDADGLLLIGLHEQKLTTVVNEHSILRTGGHGFCSVSFPFLQFVSLCLQHRHLVGIHVVPCCLHKRLVVFFKSVRHRVSNACVTL